MSDGWGPRSGTLGVCAAGLLYGEQDLAWLCDVPPTSHLPAESKISHSQS